MNFFMIPVLAILVLLSYYKEKNVYNPIFIFCGIWLLVTILSTVNLYELNPVSDKVYGLAFLGTICFYLGASFRSNHKIILSQDVRLKKVYNDNLNYNFLIIFYALILAFTTYFALRTFVALRSGIRMETIRFYYKDFNLGIIMTAGWQYSIEHYIVATSEFAAVALLPIVITDKKSSKKRILVVELVLFLVLHMFVTGARSFVIEVAIGLLFYFLMNRDMRSFFHLQFRRIPKFIFVIIIVCAIGIVVFMTRLRRGDISIIKEMYNYFAISYPLLEVHLDMIAANPEYTYGMTLLNGLLRPFLVMLNKIGIPYPPLYQKAVDLINANDIFYAVGKGSANSFVTVFYYFFMDFGVISVVFGCLIYGYVSQSLYFNFRTNPCKRSQAIYLLLALGLFLSFVRLQITAHRYLYAFLILMISFRSMREEKSVL